MNNLLSLPEGLSADVEHFIPLLQGGDGLLVERILSYGQITPENMWYDQKKDEWVVVLEGEATILFDNGEEHTLKKGGHIFLPKHCKHRVTYTSNPCVWLAIHGNDLRER